MLTSNIEDLSNGPCTECWNRRRFLKAAAAAAAAAMVSIGCTQEGSITDSTVGKDTTGQVPTDSVGQYPTPIDSNGNSGAASFPEDGISHPDAGKTALHLAHPRFASLKSLGGTVEFSLRNERLPLLAVRSTVDSAMAFIAFCPHQRCQVEVADGVFKCPCHNSEFSYEGRVLKGPSAEDLEQVRAHVNGDVVVLDIQ